MRLACGFRRLAETILDCAALPFAESRRFRTSFAESAVQLDIFDLALRAVIGQFDFLGVENNRVLDFAVIRQAHIHTLITHPAFRLADKKPRPFFWQANR